MPCCWSWALSGLKHCSKIRRDHGWCACVKVLVKQYDTFPRAVGEISLYCNKWKGQKYTCFQALLAHLLTFATVLRLLANPPSKIETIKWRNLTENGHALSKFLPLNLKSIPHHYLTGPSQPTIVLSVLSLVYWRFFITCGPPIY